MYRVWISEIMLQQTQVSTVIPYFERFVDRFPEVKVLAEAPEEEVLRFWAGLGYYSRARNLHRGAQKIVAMGRFPQTRAEWLEIPGVGPYTAGAILSISAEQPEAILDGNVERVLSRVRRVNRNRGDIAFKARLWRLSRIFVETGFRHRILPHILNQALMELGATFCTPRNPKCLLCPLVQLCRAQEYGEMESYPPKKKKKEWLQVSEKLHCVLDTQGRVLLRKRQKGEWRAGLWDLIEQDPQEIHPKIKATGSVETRHIVTRHKIRRLTQVWQASEPQLFSTHEDLVWVQIQNPEVAVGSALNRTLKAVKDL